MKPAGMSDYQWENENMAGQGEGFVSRAQLAREEAQSLADARRRAAEWTQAGEMQRAEYWTMLADQIEFGYQEAVKRRAERQQ